MAKDTLKNFILEHFDFDGLKECGLFKDVKRSDYQSQSHKICKFFGLKTIYEYGATEIKAHISFADGRPMHINEDGELKSEPFVTVIPSIYE